MDENNELTEEIIHQKVQNELLTFGKVVALFLELRGLSREELSRETDLDLILLEILISDRIWPTVKVAFTIALALDIPDEIFQKSFRNTQFANLRDISTRAEIAGIIEELEDGGYRGF